MLLETAWYRWGPRSKEGGGGGGAVFRSSLVLVVTKIQGGWRSELGVAVVRIRQLGGFWLEPRSQELGGGGRGGQGMERV